MTLLRMYELRAPEWLVSQPGSFPPNILPFKWHTLERSLGPKYGQLLLHEQPSLLIEKK